MNDVAVVREGEAAVPPRRRSAAPWVAASLLYGAVALVGIGFVLLAVTWGRIAALDAVALQLPYLVSGGLTGIALIVMGSCGLSIHQKSRDAAARSRQLRHLSDLLWQLGEDDAQGDPTPVPALVGGQRRFAFRWQPAHWATVIGVGLIATGFLALHLAWRGVAGLLTVPFQLPYVASGGLAGVALIGFGAAVLNTQVSRHFAAGERLDLTAVTSGAARLQRSDDVGRQDDPPGTELRS